MAQRFLISGGTGNWNSTTNWSTTSGGTSGASFPVAGDDVYLGYAQPAVNLTVNVVSACLGFYCNTGYTGTLAMNAQITTSGNTTLSSGMTITSGGTPALTFGNTSTITSNGKTWPCNVTFSPIVSQTYTFADDFRMLGNCAFTGNLANFNGNNIYIGAGLPVTAGNIGTNGGTTTFVLNGTGTWALAGMMRNNLTINTTGTTTIAGVVNYNTGTLTYSAGTVITTGSTLFIANNTTLNTNGITWNNITFNISSASIITLLSDLHINGLFTDTGSGGFIHTYNGFTIYMASCSQANPFIVGTTAFVFNGTGVTNTWNNTNGSSASRFSGSNVTINTIGTLTLSNGLHPFIGTLIYSAGTVITTGNTLVIGGNSTLNTAGIVWNNIFVNAVPGWTITNNSLLTVNNTLTNQVNTTWAGTAGWTTNNFSTVGGVAGSVFTLQTGLTYTINSGMTTIGGTAGSRMKFASSNTNATANLVLTQGATQDNGYLDGTDIDSSAGQTILSYKGTLLRTVNWNVLSTNNKTVGYSF